MTGESLADGQWHRLHPMTPLLRGGIAFVAILGVILVNLRDLWVDIILGPVVGDDGTPGEDEPVQWLLTSQWLGLALAVVAVVLFLVVLGFWLSWRMHLFRVTDELVEVRSGVLFRTHRRGRLDRIQGVNVVRPLLARIVGAAKLDVAVAGQDGNIPLAFLGSKQADALRADILGLAAGARGGQATAVAARSGSIIQDRVAELLAPELDPAAAPPASVVQMHPARLAGSLLLSTTTIIALVLIGVIVAIISATGELVVLVTVVPILIGLVGVTVQRFTKSLRYSIAATPDGIRVGYGLLSTANETLPPGRIHAVHIHQPLLWRPFGWWAITISRATTQSMDSSGNRASTSLLPVGDLDDVRRVLGLVLPDLADDTESILAGITGSGEAGGFTVSPPRARLVRWFSRRRNGIAIASGALLLRTGAVWRQLSVVPLARIQSVSLSRGMLARAQRLAAIEAHVVGAASSPRVGALDEADAAGWFGTIADRARTAIAEDRTHRWRADAADAVAQPVDTVAQPVDTAAQPVDTAAQSAATDVRQDAPAEPAAGGPA